VLRRFLLIFVPSALVLAIAALYFNSQETEKQRLIIENTELMLLHQEGSRIRTAFNHIVFELISLAENHALREFLESGESSHLGDMASDWLSLNSKRGFYDQIRYIDETGMEVVRINNNNGSPVVVPDKMLQDKSRRYYFADTFRLGRNEIFVSPFDLNIEQGQIETPLKPMIRFGTPVFDSTGSKRGVIVLNYLGKQILDNLRKKSISQGSTMLLNTEGHFLLAPDTSKEWGFMYNKDLTFQKENPEAWERISGSEDGQFYQDGKLLTFLTINPMKETWLTSTGSPEPYEASRSQLNGKDYIWKAVSIIPESHISAKAGAGDSEDLYIYFLFLSFLAAVTWPLARAMQRRELNDQQILTAKEEWETTFDAILDPVMLLDTDYRIVRANRATAEKLGLRPEELAGLTCYKHVHGTEKPHESCPHRKLIEDGQPHEEEVHEERLGGYFMVSVAPIYDSKGNVKGSVHYARDITKRKQAEEAMKGLLGQKETLIQEIHHRVKNNLAVISSLLSLQSRQAKDDTSREILNESMSRVRAMGLIHERLYTTDEHARIEFCGYLRSLATELVRGQTTGTMPSLEIEAPDELMLDVDTVIPCGLVINELLTNSLKHAFPGDRRGRILIMLKDEGEGRISITVSDNGTGLPPDFSIQTIDSMGMKIVSSLVTQLGGALEISDNTPGTSFHISFTEKAAR
jgi:PAS domain S-box-containing protein